MFVIKVKRRFLQVKSNVHSWKQHRKPVRMTHRSDGKNCGAGQEESSSLRASR